MNLKIAYKTNNSLEHLLTQKHDKHHNNTQNKFQKSGVYQLICKDCNKKYTGETGRSFHMRFKEHFRNYSYKNDKSNFGKHLIATTHTFGPVDEVMDILYMTKKGKLMDTLERFYIYDKTKRNNQINDKREL